MFNIYYIPTLPPANKCTPHATSPATSLQDYSSTPPLSLARLLMGLLLLLLPCLLAGPSLVNGEYSHSIAQ